MGQELKFTKPVLVILLKRIILEKKRVILDLIVIHFKA